MKRRIVVLILTFVMVTMSVAGCGRSENDKKDEPATERVEEPENKPEEADPVESTDEEDAESSDETTDQTEEPENDPAEAPADSEQANSDAATPSGFTYPNAIQDLLADEDGAKVYNIMKERSGYTYDQIELLCACVKESVINNYLTPNSLTAEDIKWPASEVSEDGTETWDSTGWAYLAAVNRRDEMGGDPNTPVMSEDTMPDEQMCKLMDSVYEGMLTWQSLAEGNSIRIIVSDHIFPALDYSTE